jgi:ATP-dependent DNA helicase RecQ
VAERAGVGPRKAAQILDLHDQADPDAVDPVHAVVRLAEARRALDRSRVDVVREYAETRRCRMEFLLAYFGEPERSLCGRCDNCVAGLASEPDPEGPYAVGGRVTHQEFGAGLVSDVEEDRLTVLFDDVGYRTLSLAVVEEQGLLDLA